MDGLTFQRFLMATFCVICQSVTRGIARKAILHALPFREVLFDNVV